MHGYYVKSYKAPDHRETNKQKVQIKRFKASL